MVRVWAKPLLPESQFLICNYYPPPGADGVVKWDHTYKVSHRWQALEVFFKLRVESQEWDAKNLVMNNFFYKGNGIKTYALYVIRVLFCQNSTFVKRGWVCVYTLSHVEIFCFEESWRPLTQWFRVGSWESHRFMSTSTRSNIHLTPTLLHCVTWRLPFTSEPHRLLWEIMRHRMWTSCSEQHLGHHRAPKLFPAHVSFVYM